MVLAVGGIALVAWALPRTAIAEALRHRRERAVRRTGLPALLDAIASALAAGLSMEQAFSEVATTLPAGLARPTAAVGTSLRLVEPV